MPERTIAVRVDEELYKKIRMRLAEQCTTLKDYIQTLIKADIEGSKEHLQASVSYDIPVTKESLAEAQKILDFVSKLVDEQDGK